MLISFVCFAGLIALLAAVGGVVVAVKVRRSRRHRLRNYVAAFAAVSLCLTEAAQMLVNVALLRQR